MNLLYAQSGGPTSVINTTAYGVFSKARELKKFSHIYAGLNGIEGILKEKFYEIQEDDDLHLLKQTPGAAFGSCRHNLTDYKKDDSEYKKLIEILKKYNITHFLYNGGNDSMETVLKLNEYFKLNNVECLVLGIPKTIDNDLLSTDHTPGYGSACKYIASTFANIVYDAKSYTSGRVNIIEIMGRDTGWLTCASALSSIIGFGPDLIYIPEVAFDIDDFTRKVKEIYSEKKHCFVAVSEGIKDKEGNFVSISTSKDSFGHTQLGGVGASLSNYLSSSGIKTRSIELNLPQRAAPNFISEVDSKEAFDCGSKAVEFILSNQSGQMVCIDRDKTKEYNVSYILSPIDQIGGKVKYVPNEYYDANKNYVTSQFLDYALPLINGEIEIENTFEGLPKFYTRKSR